MTDQEHPDWHARARRLADRMHNIPMGAPASRKFLEQAMHETHREGFEDGRAYRDAELRGLEELFRKTASSPALHAGEQAAFRFCAKSLLALLDGVADGSAKDTAALVCEPPRVGGISMQEQWMALDGEACNSLGEREQ
jgi:hypothetical protein